MTPLWSAMSGLHITGAEIIVLNCAAVTMPCQSWQMEPPRCNASEYLLEAPTPWVPCWSVVYVGEPATDRRDPQDREIFKVYWGGPADINLDGAQDLFDMLAWQASPYDWNEDGVTNAQDGLDLRGWILRRHR